MHFNSHGFSIFIRPGLENLLHWYPPTRRKSERVLLTEESECVWVLVLLLLAIWFIGLKRNKLQNKIRFDVFVREKIMFPKWKYCSAHSAGTGCGGDGGEMWIKLWKIIKFDNFCLVSKIKIKKILYLSQISSKKCIHKKEALNSLPFLYDYLIELNNSLNFCSIDTKRKRE